MSYYISSWYNPARNCYLSYFLTSSLEVKLYSEIRRIKFSWLSIRMILVWTLACMTRQYLEPSAYYDFVYDVPNEVDVLQWIDWDFVRFTMGLLQLITPYDRRRNEISHMLSAWCLPMALIIIFEFLINVLCFLNIGLQSCRVRPNDPWGKSHHLVATFRMPLFADPLFAAVVVSSWVTF